MSQKAHLSDADVVGDKVGPAALRLEPTARVIQRGFAGIWQIPAGVATHVVAHRHTGCTREQTAVHAGMLHQAHAWGYPCSRFDIAVRNRS